MSSCNILPQVVLTLKKKKQKQKQKQKQKKQKNKTEKLISLSKLRYCNKHIIICDNKTK